VQRDRISRPPASRWVPGLLRYARYCWPTITAPALQRGYSGQTTRWAGTEPNLAYNVEAWNSFLIAISAADGVLLGLMITAITVRISLIEARSDLTARAWGLLAVLFDVLVAALCSLAPIGRVATGVLLAAFGADIARNFLLYLLSKAPPKPSQVWPFIISTPVVIVLAPIPTVVGGIGLAIHRGGGLYWTGFGLILTLGYAVLFLWGLLFEPRSMDEDRQSHIQSDLPADLET
jgi:hypothetical protein